jgi:hypothetical protein
MPHLHHPLRFAHLPGLSTSSRQCPRHELEARLPASLAANRVICDHDCLFRQISVGIGFAYSSLQRGSL